MANLHLILRDFYFRFENGQYVVNPELQPIVNDFVQTRNLEKYQSQLQAKFEPYFLSLEESRVDSDSDEKISSEEQDLLDRCIHQSPIILANGYTESDLFFAVITTQLPQFFANPQNNAAIFSPYIWPDVKSGELFIFSAPFTSNNKRIAEDYLDKSVSKTEKWGKLREMFVKQSNVFDGLNDIVDQFLVDFNVWLSARELNIPWSVHFTSNDFFYELWTAFTNGVFIPSFAQASQSSIISTIEKLSAEIQNFNFETGASLEDMLQSCCQNMKTFLETLRNASPAPTKDMSISTGSAAATEGVRENNTNDIAVSSASKRTFWRFFCCHRSPCNDLTKPLISPVSGGGIAE